MFGETSVVEKGESASNLPAGKRFLTQLDVSSGIEEKDNFSGESSNGLTWGYLAPLEKTPNYFLSF